MKMKFILLLLCVSLSGCATMFEDVRIAQAERQEKFYIGMTINEVIQIIGRQPNSISDGWRTENTSDGVHKVWIVNGGGMGGNFIRTYTFRFKDEKLASWGWQ